MNKIILKPQMEGLDDIYLKACYFYDRLCRYRYCKSNVLLNNDFVAVKAQYLKPIKELLHTFNFTKRSLDIVCLEEEIISNSRLRMIHESIYHLIIKLKDCLDNFHFIFKQISTFREEYLNLLKTIEYQLKRLKPESMV